MADQSGKVGEIYIEAKVVPRVDEASLRTARDTVQAGVSGGRGMSGARAAARAEAMLEAREVANAVGAYQVSRSHQNVAIQGAIAASRFNLGIMNRVERTWDAYDLAVQKQGERVSERVDRSWNAAALAQMKAESRASARADAALSSYSDPMDLSSAVRDAERKGAVANRLENENAERRRRTLGQRAYDLGQTNVMGTGMLMQFMFGGWEVASAIRNGMVGNMATTGMGPTKAMGAQAQLVSQLQSGPLGSLAGQMVDPLSLRTASLQAAAQTATLAQTNEQAMVGLFETARLSAGGVRAAGGRGSAGQITSLQVAQEKSLSEIRMNRNAMMRSIADEAQARAAEIATTEAAGARSDVIYGGLSFNAPRLARGFNSFWEKPDTSAADRVRRLQQQAATAQFATLEASVVAETNREIAAIREDNSRQYQMQVNDRLLTIRAENESAGLSMRRAGTISQQGIFALERETIAKDTAMRSYTTMLNTPFSGAGMMYEMASVQFGAASRMANVDRAERDYNTSMAHQNTNFIAERQRAMMQTARETFGYQSVGRQLDFLLDRGNPFSATNAQAQGIVDNALLAASVAKNSQQRDLVLENARKELELLSRPQISPVSGGTPSLFVGGGAPVFNAAPFQQQLQNPQLPGANPPSATQVQQIIDLLTRFIS